MNLCQTKQGSRIRILSINGGNKITKRLCELGLYPGAWAYVERNAAGPIILKILGSKIAIGRGQAKKIEVI